jgi:hypothetical protein
VSPGPPLHWHRYLRQQHVSITNLRYLTLLSFLTFSCPDRTQPHLFSPVSDAPTCPPFPCSTSLPHPHIPPLLMLSLPPCNHAPLLRPSLSSSRTHPHMQNLLIPQDPCGLVAPSANLFIPWRACEIAALMISHCDHIRNRGSYKALLEPRGCSRAVRGQHAVCIAPCATKVGWQHGPSTAAAKAAKADSTSRAASASLIPSHSRLC